MRKICCFAGHHDFYDTDNTKERLIQLITKLIENEDVNELWVGHYGRFDALAGECVREVKKKYSHIKLNLVIPYVTNEINEYKEFYYRNYDNILIADIPENAPRRFHISYCNKYMVQKSDFIICYVSHSFGGAAKTMKYAKNQKNIRIFNLAEN